MMSVLSPNIFYVEESFMLQMTTGIKQKQTV